MGNETSVPAREPYVNQQASYATMLRNVNQSRLIGNPDPVTQAAGADEQAILKAASPKGLDLTETTLADRSELEAKAAECRRYTGLGGIRDLELKAGTRTAMEPGCGWLYKKDENGITVNRGAFGSEGDPSNPNNLRAPIFSRQGERDETRGAQFEMDLEKLERKISYDIVNDIRTCQAMAAKVNVSDVAPYIGFCKTSGRVIPVQRRPTGGAIARFTDDVEFRCAPDQIILPENTPSCPPPGSTPQAPRILGKSVYLGKERFINYSGVVAGGGVRPSNVGSFEKAFNQPNWALNNQMATVPQNMQLTREGFANQELKTDTDFERCKVRGTLVNDGGSKACIILAARNAYFADTGSFLKFMTTGQTTPVFENYKRLLPTTDFIPSSFMDGTRTINDIINTLTNVRLNIDNSNDEISTAARDIVNDAGAYSAQYNLCSWIDKTDNDADPIRKGDLSTEACLQNYWRNRSGDSRGIEFPTLARWEGSTIGQFKHALDNVIAPDLKSTDMDKQSEAIAKLIGVNTYKEQVSVKSIETAQDCEKELDYSTEGSVCKPILQRGQPVPEYIIKYRVKPGKDAVAGGNCVTEEKKACTPIFCDPVDCQGEWTEGACSATCGDGTKTLTYKITRPAQCGGRQCEATAGETKTAPCKTRECNKDDCKYTRQPVRACPTDPASVANCGKQFTSLTNLVPDESYPPNIGRLCPTTPLVESCGPAVACPAIIPATVPSCEVIVYYDYNYSTNQGFARYTVGSYQYPLGAPAGTLSPDGRNFLNPGNGQSGQNDRIRSIRVGSGVTVKVFPGYINDPNYPTATFSSDVPDLRAHGMSDTISSLIVAPKPGGPCQPPRPAIPDCEVWAYYETNYQPRPGFPAYTVLKVGNYDWQNEFLKSWDPKPTGVNTKPVDDQIKSLLVGRGVKITVFPHPGFTGGGTTYTTDQPNLGGMYGFGPGVSSAKIEHNGQVQACLPPAPTPPSIDQKCGQRILIGQVKLGVCIDKYRWFDGFGDRPQYGGTPQYVNFMFDNFVNAASVTSWDQARLGMPITFGTTMDGKEIWRIMWDMAKANGIPNHWNANLGKWWAGTGSIHPYYSSLRPYDEGIAPRPYIRARNSTNTNFMTQYVGKTFCIILETPDGSSGITMVRCGSPFPEEGGWQIRATNERAEIWNMSDWRRMNGLTDQFPSQTTLQVKKGVPRLGQIYNLYLSIRSDDISEARSRGYEVIT
jgi:hypothetical protein